MHEVDIEKIREAAHTHKRKHRTKSAFRIPRLLRLVLNSAPYYGYEA
jgi:hypothetical protein